MTNPDMLRCYIVDIRHIKFEEKNEKINENSHRCFGGHFIVMILLYIVFAMWWNGAFDQCEIRDIESYESPDGSYNLIFQQLGDAKWSFGSAEVQLVLEDKTHKQIDSIDISVQNDGANANSGNIKSIEWGQDSVIIILQASEMKDKEVILKWK